MASVGAFRGGEAGAEMERVIIRSSDPAARARLREMAQEAGEISAELPIVDGFAASISRERLQEMRQTLGVQADDVTILPDTPVHLDDPVEVLPVEAAPVGVQVEAAIQTLQLDKIWAQGFKGKGVGIAVLDTGIAPHPDLASRIVAFKDFVNGKEQPYDDRGHGTHVAGIAAGNGSASHGKYTGAAPEASLVGVKVMNAQGEGQLSDIIQGLQWAIENREQYNIRVVNMSLGARPSVPVKDDPLAQAALKATQAGLLVVAAAGNKGPYPGTIDTPATSPAVLSVGATVDYGTPDISDDKVAWYSGSGPTSFDNRVKPDVVAPGTNIVCADATGGWYVRDTGTSMATPLVAGAAALMLQARPDLRPDEVQALMRDTAQKIRSYGENIQGKGVPRPLIMLDKLVKHGDDTAE